MNTYPDNWQDIATAIKDLADWHCEACGHHHDRSTWHVLTVHHLDGDKANCTYRNLVALCQRCHLRIQAYYHPAQMLLPLPIDPPAWMAKRGLVGNEAALEDVNAHDLTDELHERFNL